MKLIAAIAAGVISLTAGSIYAAESNQTFEHYLFRYDSGDTYDVHLTDNAITWKALEGSDTGMSETDYINRKKLSNEVEVIQWTENSGIFVTLVIDRKNLKTISSGKTSSGNWLNFGTVEVKPFN